MSERGHQKGINWDRQPLGKKTDAEIAEQLGVAPSTVREARQRRGIPKAPYHGRCGIDWGKQPLGIDTDAAIARRLGVPMDTVRTARRRRGIIHAQTVVGTKAVRREAVKLRRKKWTHNDIGYVFGVSGVTVMRWLRKEGVR